VQTGPLALVNSKLLPQMMTFPVYPNEKAKTCVMMWCWTVPGAVTGDCGSAVTFDATGHGTDLNVNKVTYPDYPGEYAYVTVTITSCVICRITGGGTIDDITERHGFELHRKASTLPNRLDVNWGKWNRLHLLRLDEAICSDDPSISPTPPVCNCDTYEGWGVGRYNGQTDSMFTGFSPMLVNQKGTFAPGSRSLARIGMRSWSNLAS
jgi:hypothetical protein